MPQGIPCLHKPVHTTAGRYLGRVIAVEVDPSTHQVVFYHVAALPWVRYLWQQPLLVAPSQVVKFTTAGLVVNELIAVPNLAGTIN